MEKELSVIVPLTKMSGRLSEISTWLEKLPQRDLQVLIVHDIQDQNTSLELKSLINSCADSRIVLFEREFGSPGNARNYGLENAKSKWVIFVDSDDIVNLSEVFSIIDHYDGISSALVGQYEIRDRETNQVFKNVSNSDPKLDIAINPGIWRIIFLREWISKLKFSTSLMGEDQLFLLDLGIFAAKIQFFNEVVYTYYKNSSGQLTYNKDAVRQLNLIIPKTLYHLKNSEKSQRRYVSMMLLRQLLTQAKNLEKKTSLNWLALFYSEIKNISLKNCVNLGISALQLAVHKGSNAR